jgi:hypothetical protein
MLQIRGPERHGLPTFAKGSKAEDNAFSVDLRRHNWRGICVLRIGSGL